MTVDPEAVRSAVTQRRATAEAATTNIPWQWCLVNRDAKRHIEANSPAAVLALCDGAGRILDRHTDVLDGSHSGLCACGDYYPCETVVDVAAMFGVTQEGTP